MKYTILALASSLLMAATLAACGNNKQNEATEQAKKVQAAIQQNIPGTIPTSAGSYTMTAKVDGKNWAATSMMPPELASRLIGYYNGEYIGLPYDRRDLVVGKKITFGENNAVDLATNDDIGIWGGRKGEMIITKVDEKSAEGTFFFTASTSSTTKTIEVTDGFFRIPLDKN